MRIAHCLRNFLAAAALTAALAGAAAERPLGAAVPARAWEACVRPFLLPVRALAFAISPDPARLARPWRDTDADPARAAAAADPVEEQIRRVTFAGKPELRQKPAPFLRLAIPDPLGPATALRLLQQPPDADPPAAAADKPPKPVLPATQPNK
jgi:hypothetical protein